MSSFIFKNKLAITVFGHRLRICSISPVSRCKQLSDEGRPNPARQRGMALRDEFPVLLSGLQQDTCPHLLWAALEEAGLTPYVLGCPRALMDQGRCYVLFREQSEAVDAAALSGALRVHGRAFRIRLLHDRSWRARLTLVDTSSGDERPPPPTSPPPGTPRASCATAAGPPPPAPTIFLPRPPPAPPPKAAAPAAAAGPAMPAAVPLGVVLLAAMAPLVPPGAAARLGMRIHRVRHLRFHEEYYGIYFQVSQGGRLLEGHASVLHCTGCAERLSHDQVRRVEDRCRNLRGMVVQLAHVPMVMDWRRGLLHRAWCYIHVHSALSQELWRVRGLLSSWIPSATARENRANFHVSFDGIVQ